jgi:hypothetical protein
MQRLICKVERRAAQGQATALPFRLAKGAWSSFATADAGEPRQRLLTIFSLPLRDLPATSRAAARSFRIQLEEA